MQEQVRFLIEREVRCAQVGVIERARRWRSLLAGRHFPDLAADIQADRISTDQTRCFCTGYLCPAEALSGRWSIAPLIGARHATGGCSGDALLLRSNMTHF